MKIQHAKHRFMKNCSGIEKKEVEALEVVVRAKLQTTPNEQIMEGMKGWIEDYPFQNL